MFRNPVGEFSLSSRRAFRPRCEQLEERIVLDNTTMPATPAPATFDPTAEGFVGSLAVAINKLSLRLSATIRSVRNGQGSTKALLSRAIAFQHLSMAIQQVEQQVEQVVGTNDPAFNSTVRLFNLAVNLLNSKLEAAGLKPPGASNPPQVPTIPTPALVPPFTLP